MAEATNTRENRQLLTETELEKDMQKYILEEDETDEDLVSESDEDTNLDSDYLEKQKDWNRVIKPVRNRMILYLPENQ